MGWWKEIVAPDASSNDSSSTNTCNHSASVRVLRGRRLQGSLPSAKSLTFHQHRNDRSSWEPWSPPLSIVSRHGPRIGKYSSCQIVAALTVLLDEWMLRGRHQSKKFFLIPLYPNQDSTINDLFWFLSCSMQRSLFLICELLLRTEQSRDLNIPPSKRINTKRCLDSGTMNVSYVHEYGPFPQGHIYFSNYPQMTDNVYSHL